MPAILHFSIVFWRFYALIERFWYSRFVVKKNNIQTKAKCLSLSKTMLSRSKSLRESVRLSQCFFFESFFFLDFLAFWVFAFFPQPDSAVSYSRPSNARLFLVSRLVFVSLLYCLILAQAWICGFLCFLSQILIFRLISNSRITISKTENLKNTGPRTAGVDDGLNKL